MLAKDFDWLLFLMGGHIFFQTLSAAVQWVANFIVSTTFPPIAYNLGLGVAYGLYAAFAALSFVFVIAFIKETKGKKLEEIVPPGTKQVYGNVVPAATSTGISAQTTSSLWPCGGPPSTSPPSRTRTSGFWSRAAGQSWWSSCGRSRCRSRIWSGPTGTDRSATR